MKEQKMVLIFKKVLVMISKYYKMLINLMVNINYLSKPKNKRYPSPSLNKILIIQKVDNFSTKVTST